jgi:hypothetical protein
MCTYSMANLCLSVKGVAAQAATLQGRFGGWTLVACYTFRMRPFTITRQLNVQLAAGIRRQPRSKVLLSLSIARRWSPGCPSSAG